MAGARTTFFFFLPEKLIILMSFVIFYQKYKKNNKNRKTQFGRRVSKVKKNLNLYTILNLKDFLGLKVRAQHLHGLTIFPKFLIISLVSFRFL